MKSRERVIAPGLSFDFALVVIWAGSGRSALKCAKHNSLVSTAGHDVLCGRLLRAQFLCSNRILGI